MVKNTSPPTNGEYQPTRVELFKQNHDIAFNFLKKGIELDESKQLEKARDYYREGIQSILLAERVPLSQQERYQAKAMLDKLSKHKTMFYERVKEIDQILFNEQKAKQTQLENISNTSSSGGFFSGFMKMFTTPPNSSSSNNTQQAISQETRKLCSVNNNRHEPIYNQYPTNSQVIRSFPTVSPIGSTTNMYNSVNICDGISSDKRLPTPPRARSNSNDNILFGAHYDALGSLPQNNMGHQSPQVSQQPQQQQQIPKQHSITTLRNTASSSSTTTTNNQNNKKPSLDQIPELKGVDRKLLDHILNEVIETKTTNWDDIAGLKDAKQTLLETVILPSIRPDLFNGLRAPCRGILLFGPPGTGKTLLARACASQCNATFFSISAGSLVSKYHGEGEKLVRCLFAAARYLQPSVIFIDEIDSILSARSSEEHEASRRMKTEFMIQMDGVSNMNGKEDRVLVMGATNIPTELDEAILRRFTKRIYIPLPDHAARASLIKQLSHGQNMNLSETDINTICLATEGFSGSDLTALCKETSMVPLREISMDQLISIDARKIRPIMLKDFQSSLVHVRPSTSQDTIKKLEKWNESYGTFAKGI